MNLMRELLHESLLHGAGHYSTKRMRTSVHDSNAQTTPLI